MTTFTQPPSLTRVSDVWFDASPDWRINVPLFARSAIACVAIVLLSVLLAWLTPLWLLALTGLLIPIGTATQALATTATTRIVIDTQRITVRSGLMVRRTASIDLVRVQNIDAIAPWWQERMGFSTLRLETSDAFRPVWELPGMPDASAWRDYLTDYVVRLRMARGIRDVNLGTM